MTRTDIDATTWYSLLISALVVGSVLAVGPAVADPGATSTVDGPDAASAGETVTIDYAVTYTGPRVPV